MIVLLDSGPLGLVTNPRMSGDATRCNEWLEGLLRGGTAVFVPEIADYEVRRELLQANRMQGVGRLDALLRFVNYLPITTPAMRRAAEMWAEARREGRPTADPKALDGDVILAAQARLVEENGDEVVVATTNVGHLARFVSARRWQDVAE